jgi:glycosyltransferase involved in cell wall biosynthesis
VRVYHQPAGTAIGGAEVVSAVLAAALRGRHDVELVHHHPTLTAERLAEFAEVGLDGIAVRFVPKPERANWFPADAPAWRLGREMRRWKADLSAGCDVFVTSTHEVPPFNAAGGGAMYVHFPLFDRRAAWPWNAPPGSGLGRLKNRLRLALHERLWRERMAGYRVALANSRFTADHLRDHWGVAGEVVYPPVKVDVTTRPKANVIAVLGRFTPMKRQLDLVRAFADRAATDFRGWELVCAGTVGKEASEQDYFRRVREAAGSAVTLLPDAPREAVADLLRRAAVFWHAAGLGVDESAQPHLAEHFGMATVEAMAAGCVPVVADCGGQREIVRPGEDGFLCGDIGAMADAAATLARDGVLRERLSAAAKARAAAFGRERFIAGVREKLRPLVGDVGGGAV